jgi:hypothetical protein
MVDDIIGDHVGDADPDGTLARILGSLTEEDREFTTPPTGLWDMIANELGVDDAGSRPARLAVVDPADEATEQPLATVVPLTPRGRWGLAFIAGAAALVAMVVSFATWRAVSDKDDVTVIASVPISSEGLGTSSELTGRAELIEEDGVLYIQLDVGDLPSPDGYIEAWLIDTDVQGMYPLGAVNGDVRLPVPHGVEPTDFPIVDLSVEPLDGDPTHSGVSILRGQLTF